MSHASQMASLSTKLHHLITFSVLNVFATIFIHVVSHTVKQTTVLFDGHSTSFELRHEKTGFFICDNKSEDQLHGNRAADQSLCFASKIVQSLYFLILKFLISNHLCLYSPVCDGPDQVFSLLASNGDFFSKHSVTYEPRHEKTGFLHMRKQRRRSASQ